MQKDDHQDSMSDCESCGAATPGKYGLQIADTTVRAKISSDLTMDERKPLLEIDGQEVTREEFGRMLMTFEGWQFRMEVVDRSDEV